MSKIFRNELKKHKKEMLLLNDRTEAWGKLMIVLGRILIAFCIIIKDLVFF